MIKFGVGQAYGTRQGVANATPRQFGILQEVSLDISMSQKELYGQYKFPIDVAPSTGKITGKAKYAQFSAATFNELFLDGATTVGEERVANGEDGLLAASAVTVANAANFVEDLGVIYAATGLPLKKVASAPAVGQYSVTVGGVYSFNTADQTAQTAAGATPLVAISYRYSVAGSGQIITLNNTLMGSGAEFSLVWNESYKGKQVTWQLFKCIATKMPAAGKNEDYAVSDLEFSAFANSAGKILRISTPE